jgi:TolB-like protein
MRRPFDLTTLLLIAVAAGGFACASRPVTQASTLAPTRMSVAVLAFENHSIGPAEATRGIGQTVTDRVTEELTGRPDVRLIDRESLQKVLEELSLSSRDLVGSDDQLKLGRLLGAHYLIAGGVMAIGETLRIDGRIIEVEKGMADGMSIQGSLKERETLERTFSAQVVDRITTKVGPVRSLPKTGQDYFLQGTKFEGANRPAQALEMYQKALALDPQHQDARERMEHLLLKEIQ